MTKRRRDPKLMLLAGIFSLLVGLLFALLPAHNEPAFRRWIGVLWFLTGSIWLLAWWKTRRRQRAR